MDSQRLKLLDNEVNYSHLISKNKCLIPNCNEVLRNNGGQFYCCKRLHYEFNELFGYIYLSTNRYKIYLYLNKPLGTRIYQKFPDKLLLILNHLFKFDWNNYHLLDDKINKLLLFI